MPQSASPAQQLDQALKSHAGADLLAWVVAQLRNPAHGCPWDLKQTHESLKPYLLEESYETIDAIEQQDHIALKEELGDVLLQVVLHAQLAQEAGDFTFDALAQEAALKIIARHPHVFKDQANTIETPEAVNQQWETLKKAEGKPTVWEKPPRYLPALLYAHKLSKTAVKEGFKWPHLESLWECVMSEMEEIKETLPLNTQTGESLERQEEELGDALFALVSLAGHLGLNPEVALSKASEKFLSRYTTLKTLTPKAVNQHSYQELDDLWKQAKIAVSAQS